MSETDEIQGREAGSGSAPAQADRRVGELPDPAANGFRDTWCGRVLVPMVDGEVRVAGWVNRRRDHGGLIFIDLRDRTGVVQLVFHPDTPGEAFELAHKLRSEDVLSVAGKVVRRDAETIKQEYAQIFKV